MPIRINLLAEAQSAEEMKRRNPVKFAIYGGALFIVAMFVWSSGIQLQSMAAKGDLARVQAQIQSKTNAYQTALINEGKVTDAKKKLEALAMFTESRFLQGNLLNALQQTTVDGVQLMRVRMDQSYSRVEATKPTQNGEGRTTPGKPATVTAKTVLFLDAKDSSTASGDQVNKFKEAIASNAYFKTELSKTNGVQLVSVSPPQVGIDGRPYVLFFLECDYPEVTR
jgi:hypothetical protein